MSLHSGTRTHYPDFEPPSRYPFFLVLRKDLERADSILIISLNLTYTRHDIAEK
jgi:hypothetical protein